MTRTIAFTAAALAFWAGDASAVIINAANGSGNTVAPVGLPQFNNVGTVNGSSGIYLGDGWVLTAHHVGAGAFTLPAVSPTAFTVMPGTTQRLKNPDNSNTDLTVFRLNSTPLLPTLSIATTTPGVGTSATMVGNGYNRLDNLSDPNARGLTYWDVTGPANAQVWSETNNPANAEAAGYKWNTSSRTIRWGDNQTVDASSAPGVQPTTVINAGFGNVTVLVTRFDDIGTSEGMAAGHDSGGALFDSTGRLIGVLDAIGTANGQPANTAVFGNVTYSADLATYYSEIVRTTGIPEPTSLGLFAIGLLSLKRRR